MSDFVIADGTGKGHKAQVTSANRIKIESVQQSFEQRHNGHGHSYNVETPVINLTSGNESGVLYIKNNEDSDLIIMS